MSDFDRRWQRLARAAARASAAPLPPAPDGARLLRRAKDGAVAVAPWPRPLASALAVGLLWAVAGLAATPAWRVAREALVRLEPGSPHVPSTLPSPALAKPRLPPLPDLSRRLPWVEPAGLARPKETPS